MPLTSDERKWISTVEECLKQGHTPLGVTSRKGEIGAIAAAALKLGINRQTFVDRLSRLAAKGHAPNWALYAPPVPEDVAIRRKTSDELTQKRKAVLELERRLAAAEDIRAQAFGLKGDMERFVPPSFPQVKVKSRHKPQIAMLVISDEQAGEVIKRDQIDYPNDYNPEIYRKRIRRVVETAILLSKLHDGGVEYEGLILSWIGDSISGAIHADLAETQDTTAPQQAILVAEEMISAIQRLLDAKRDDGRPLFPLIRLVWVPGNHDRDTYKPRSKEYVAHTYTIMAMYAIEMHFSALKEKRLQIFRPPSGDALIQVYDQKILLTHGDRLGSRGGKGFIGAEATILRGAHLTRKQYSGMGKPIDLIICGHWHISRDLKIVIVNGSIAGPGEYSMKELRCEPEEPSQTILFFERDRGLIDRRAIFCEESQRRVSSATKVEPAFA